MVLIGADAEPRWYERTDVWTDRSGNFHTILDMTPEYIGNTIGYLTRKAVAIHYLEIGGVSDDMEATPRSHYSGEEPMDFTPLCEPASEEIALAWIQGTPIWSALNRAASPTID